jgi:predicted neutral ceramidase superfamily lipid hydrolase
MKNNFRPYPNVSPLYFGEGLGVRSKHKTTKHSNNQYKMITSKETLETIFKELLTEKTEALKKMQYLKVVELRDKVNEVLLQLEKATSVDYIKIVHGYEKTEKGYYPYIES